MARQKKDMMSGIINIVLLAVMIPVIASALEGISEDPAVTAIVAILPIILIFNAITDFL